MWHMTGVILQLSSEVFIFTTKIPPYSRIKAKKDTETQIRPPVTVSIVKH